MRQRTVRAGSSPLIWASQAREEEGEVISESGWKGTAATTSKNDETARYYSRLKEFMEAGKARDWGDSLRSATTAEVVTDAAGGVPLCHTRAARPETRRD